ncbi:glycosyltransferase family 2 protein [Candidatus Peregrinibacteria bacterium]|jgi:glycosyltransferase involved in cell wall biosynthesis|nr:glycosyltransferase family 2 protein [Candidatus Peregrinibacteria bacterium]
MKLSVIVPTLHRSQDLKVLLKSFILQTRNPLEILIIDQSDDTKTKELCLRFKKELPIKYTHSKIKSSTHNRNLGVRQAKGEVVVFLDDDTELEPDYLEQIDNFYKEHPKAIGGMSKVLNQDEIGGRVVGVGIFNKLYMLTATLFRLQSFRKGFFILKSGRNVFYFDSPKEIVAEWLSGVSWYKKEIFKEFQFDESLFKWAWGEDRMLSYQIHKKHPNSLFYYPKASLYHHESQAGRVEQKEKIYLKVFYQYWFSYKHVGHAFFYWWGNVGEILLHFLNACLRRESFKNPWYYLKANLSLIKNLKRVKKGDLKF